MRASIELTKEQRQAVTTTGTSLLVSAAAGSGKTAVLAERCAYLVCDAPEGERCDIDAMLVLTFTDAAAAEMRERIVEAIRGRVAARPEDARLRRQLALTDAAQISTIHAFCLWLIRRNFTELDLDPTAAVLDADEARLLKKDVLDASFSQLYATCAVPDDPLGAKEIGKGNQAAETYDAAGWRLGERSIAALGPAFVRLIDVYGLGWDTSIAALVVRLFDFVSSLTDPDAWLSESVRRLSDGAPEVVRELATAMALELERQREHAERLAERIETGPRAGHDYGRRIRAYVTLTRQWHETLCRPSPRSLEEWKTHFETVRSEIDASEYGKERMPSFRSGGDPAAVAVRKEAKKCYEQVKKMYGDRLRDGFARFSVTDVIDNLKRVAPYTATIADLVHAFGRQYAREKRRLGALDFADFERFAYRLLSDRDSGGPTAIARSLRARFAHVLVDEFQDISPIQREIIQLVSRENDPSAAGNLFTVGDVKQSIYRFRLAEPSLFAARQRQFASNDRGQLLFLQSNFRSRPEILDAVNLVFGTLMQGGAGEAVYDERAELRPDGPT